MNDTEKDEWSGSIGELVGDKPPVISVENCLECGKGFAEWRSQAGWHMEYCRECQAARDTASTMRACMIRHNRVTDRNAKAVAHKVWLKRNGLDGYDTDQPEDEEEVD